MVTSPLAVFQGASEAPISELIRAERATRKNSQPAAARRVASKMGRRLRCSSVTSRTIFILTGKEPNSVSKKWCGMRPLTVSPARTALPAALFERNDVIQHKLYGRITYDDATRELTVQKPDLKERLSWLSARRPAWRRLFPQPLLPGVRD